MTTERENWIDWSKVFLIYLVVVGHSNLISHENNAFLTAFHMPAFFILAGYLHRNTIGFKKNLYKNFTRLVVPTLFFSFICWCWFLLKIMIGNGDSIGSHTFYDLVLKPILGLVIFDRSIATPMCGVTWFLITMFILKISMNYILRLNTKYIILFMLLSILIVSLIPEGNFRALYFPERTIVSAPFYILGFFGKKAELKMLLVHRINGNVLLSVLLVAVLLVGTVLFSQFNGKVGIHSFTFGKNVFLFYLAACTGSFFIFSLSYLFNSFSNKIIQTLSVSTLTIMCLHRLFLELFARIPFVKLDGFSLSLIVLLALYPVVLFSNKYVPFWIGQKKDFRF